MHSVPERHEFSKSEEEILRLWKRIDAFKTTLKRSKEENRPSFTFYDGPPFATGLPHYGHILAGTIKDVVTRYAHQTGHHVERRFGWDCHGLPIEFEIDKEYGIKTKDDVMKMGIDKYNEACRGIVMRYSKEWETIVTRSGRWIDFENDYKTMDMSFMESVWWVFKQLFEKNLVYQGFKVMPYSMQCTTPLSNFEANSNYKMATDPAIIVSFPLVEDPTTSLVIWTTTPWTLPSNLGVAVHPDMTYVLVEDHLKRKLIVMESRLPFVYPPPPKKKKKKTKQKKKGEETEESESNEDVQYTILKRFQGKELDGKKYVPMFTYFEEEYKDRAFKVVADPFVTDDAGTGLVHMAPAFGEIDFNVSIKYGLVDKERVPCPVDENGRFVAPVADWAGINVKEADKSIIAHLKESGRLVTAGSIVHSVPFCWRSDTPLIYRAIPSWFVRVEDLKEKMMANNLKSYWVPQAVQEKRFHNWLKDARDWSISRNRYWGTPLPIWANDDLSEIKVIGSVAELEELTGAKGITDLHCHHIDHLTIPSSKGDGSVLKRVPEVFDCWFESGAMPYAQRHHPFENADTFEANFPADFIAEGLDQTRGWFYTLLVLSTALFDSAPFKNVVVNGLVLAADGKKMSKRLRNYPPITEILDKYGADALRLYLINSPVVRGEELRFRDSGVEAILRDVFNRWYHSYRLFVLQALAMENSDVGFEVDHDVGSKTQNVLDKWILAATQELILFVREEMKFYRLYTVVPELVKFIEKLANIYVRFNRNRFKGGDGVSAEDQSHAMSTLFIVLTTLNRAMAPFTPFFVEVLYQNMKHLLPENEREDSIHYLPFPSVDESLVDKAMVTKVDHMQEVIENGRLIRDIKKVSSRYPLDEIIVVSKDPLFLENVQSLQNYIVEELNVLQLKVTSNVTEFVKLTAKPDLKKLGARLRGDMGKVTKHIRGMSSEDLEKFEAEGRMDIDGIEVTTDEVFVARGFAGDESKYHGVSSDNGLVVLNYVISDRGKFVGISREIRNRIQRLRKSSGMEVGDLAKAYYEVTGGDASEILAALKEHQKEIEAISGASLVTLTKSPFIAEGEVDKSLFVDGKVIGVSKSTIQSSTFNVVLVVLDLSGKDMSGVDWRKVNRRGVYLQYTNLKGADLSGADLNRADLSGADLSRAYLSGANLIGANFSGANLSNAILKDAKMDKTTKLNGAELVGVDLSARDLRGWDLSGANLSYATLKDVKMDKTTKLNGAKLVGVDLSGSDLNGVDLRDADLKNAILKDVKMD